MRWCSASPPGSSATIAEPTSAGPVRPQFAVTVCVLLHRHDRWLLTVRGAGADHAAGLIGLVGGHVEPDPGADTLERTARREVAEETGVDLTGVPLTYLASEQFVSDRGRGVVDVTFLAGVGPGVEPALLTPAELSAVGWWSEDELVADPRCPPWVLRSVRLGAARLAGSADHA